MTSERQWLGVHLKSYDGHRQPATAEFYTTQL
jgi:hypothetical protein